MHKLNMKKLKWFRLGLTMGILGSQLVLSSATIVVYAEEKHGISGEEMVEQQGQSDFSEKKNKVLSIQEELPIDEDSIQEIEEKLNSTVVDESTIKKWEEKTFILTIEDQKATLTLTGKTNINDVYQYKEDLAPINHLIIDSEGEGDFDATFLADSKPFKELEILEVFRVETIPGRAFQSGKLKQVTMPHTKKIATKAFEQNQLTSVVLPEVEKLEGTVFYNNQLTKIEMPKIKEIGPWALKNNQLKEVEFLELEKISDEAFGDNLIESVNFPKATNVNATTFKNVSSIKQAEIGGSDGTFENLSSLFLSSKESLESLTVTKMRNVKKGTENDEWFNGWKLKSINLPEVRTIDEYGFNKSSFTSIEMPNVEEIKANAFANSQIQKLDMPSTIRMISEDAFKSSALELVTFREDKKELLVGAFKKAPLVLGVSETHIGNKKIELDKYLSIPMLLIINEETAKSTIQSEWWKDQNRLVKQESSSLEIKKASTSDQGVYQGKMTIHSSTGEFLLDCDSNLFNISVGSYLASPKVEKITEKDSTLTGSGIAEATIKAMVEGQEIGHGVVKQDGSFSFAIPPQTKGTTIKVFQAIAGEESEEVIVKVEFIIEMTTLPRGNPKTNKETEKRGLSHASMEPTGIFLPKNEELIIIVEEEPEDTSVKIGQWGTYNEDNLYINTEKNEFLTEKLHKGENIFKREDSGGMVYIDNRSESQHVGIAIEGGTQVPYYKQGTTSLEEFKAQLEANPNVPFIEMVSDNVIGTFQIHRAKDLIIPGNRVNELLDYWELVVKLQNEVSGLDFNVKGVNKKHNDRIHITNPDTGSGAAYASEYRVAVHTNSDRNLLTYRPTDNQWLIWHEIGHTYQNQYYEWSGLTEVTVNIQSEYIQQKLFGTNRIEGPAYAKNIHSYLTQPIENRNFDNPGEEYKDYVLYIKLAMFWNLQRVFGDNFYPALNQSYRLLPKDQLPKTDDEKKQTFMKMTSRVVKRNLTPYFEEFGLKVEEETKKELSQYSDLEKEIWKDVGFGDRQQILGLLKDYSIPTADIEKDVTVPIFTSSEQVEKIINVENTHSVPIESQVFISDVEVDYKGYGEGSEASVWLENKLGYKDKIAVKVNATPNDTVKFRGNNSGNIILGPNSKKQKFTTLVKSGRMSQQYKGTEYYRITLFNSDLSKEKGIVSGNGDSLTEDIAEEIEKLTYEIGDVVKLYHAESHVRFDRYLNDALIEPTKDKNYLYRLTEDGWQSLIDPAAPKVDTVTERDKKITGTGESGAVAIARVNEKEIGRADIGKEGDFSISIDKQEAGSTIKIEQMIEGITSPKVEIIVEGLIDITSDLIAQMVSDQLKIEKASTFTTTQIKKITSIKISGNSSFTKYDLGDITQLVYLTNLELPNNGIESIEEISSLTLLKKLDVSKNKLTKLDGLKGLIHLESLYVNQNNLTSIFELSSLIELKLLYLNNNEISNLTSLQKLVKLETLNVSNNQIENIEPLVPLTTLKDVWLDGNRLMNLQVLPNLSVIKGAKNQKIITSDQEKKDGVLRLLNVIQTNELVDTFGSFMYKPNKNGIFDDEMNQFIWENLGTYETNYTFSSENGLYTGTVTVPIKGKEDRVKLESDLLSELIAAQLKIEMTNEYTKEQLSRIESINLNSNGRFKESDLIDISKLENLKKLYLENLNIQNIDSLSSLHYLEILGVRGNSFETLDALSQLKQLKEIYATKNKLKNIDGVKDLTNLKKLWIGQGNVTNLSPLKNLTGMESLSIEYNQVSDINPLSGLVSLKELTLSNNQISDLTPIQNPSIIKDARNQTITLSKKRVLNGKVEVKNSVSLMNSENLGEFTVSPSHNGIYDRSENKVSWSDLNETKLPASVTYQFSFGEGTLFSGKVVLPITADEITLDAPLVDSILSTDTVIRGKAEPRALIIAKISGKEISRGEANQEGIFELGIESQKIGTKISISQTLNDEESTTTEIIVEQGDVLAAYNRFKLGYWRSYGFILEGQAGVEGEIFSTKGDVTKIVELVNTTTNNVETSVQAVNTNWYNPANYDGYQAILTNEIINKLEKGNYRLQVMMELENGEQIRKNLSGNELMTFDFIGEYQDTISQLGKHGVNEKEISFSEGLGQVLMNVVINKNQLNVLNSRLNGNEENVVDIWIASMDYDYRNEHSKYLVIKDFEGNEVYNEKAPTWDIKKTFGVQVKPEWERSGVQAIIQKKYRDKSYIKEVQVKDKEGNVRVNIRIDDFILK